MDRQYREALRVAFRTDPEVLESTSPMTVLAKSACELVLQAASGNASAIRLAFSILEKPADPAAETDMEPDPPWEWSTGVWRPFKTRTREVLRSGRPQSRTGTTPEEHQKLIEQAERDTEDLRDYLKQRFLRAGEGEEEEMAGPR